MNIIPQIPKTRNGILHKAASAAYWVRMINSFSVIEPYSRSKTSVGILLKAKAMEPVAVAPIMFATPHQAKELERFSDGNISLKIENVTGP